MCPMYYVVHVSTQNDAQNRWKAPKNAASSYQGELPLFRHVWDLLWDLLLLLVLTDFRDHRGSRKK